MATTTWTDIANLALSRLGANLIASLSDGTASANYVSLHLPRAYKQTLAHHDWAFARTRASLAALSDAPLYGYLYAYQLPADFVRFCCPPDAITGEPTVGVTTDGSEWRVEGQQILTDSETVYINYIADLDAPQVFPEWFTQAVVGRLASELSIALARSESMRGILYQEAVVALADAVALDTQTSPEADAVTGFLDVR